MPEKMREPDRAVLEQGVVKVLDLKATDRQALQVLAPLDDGHPTLLAVSPAASGMVRIAIDQRRAGVKESPMSSNKGVPLTRYVRWFVPGSGPQPWCAYFLSWCWDRATDSNRRVPWADPGAVKSIRAWATGTGRLVETPVHGDIFGFDDNDHCGVVAGVGGGNVWTVEGNSQDRVRSVLRSAADLWFARLP